MIYNIVLLIVSRIQQSDSVSVGGCGRRTRRGREELPHVRGQGQWPRVPGCNGAGTAKRSYPKSKVRGDGQEEPPHVQGAVAAQAQEGLEELSHVEGQERWR